MNKIAEDLKKYRRNNLSGYQSSILSINQTSQSENYRRHQGSFLQPQTNLSRNISGHRFFKEPSDTSSSFSQRFQRQLSDTSSTFSQRIQGQKTQLQNSRFKNLNTSYLDNYYERKNTFDSTQKVNRIQNPQCSLIGSSETSSQSNENNRGKRLLDVHEMIEVGTSENYTLPEGLSEKCPETNDDHLFRKPYDVRSNPKQYVQMQSRYQTNLIDNSPMDHLFLSNPCHSINSSSISSFLSVPIYTVENFNEDLSTASSVINLINIELGIPVRELEIDVKTFLMHLKRKVVELIMHKSPSNVNLVPNNAISIDKAQFLQQWLNASVDIGISAPRPPSSVCSSTFTTSSRLPEMQHPHTDFGISAPKPPSSECSSTITTSSRMPKVPEQQLPTIGEKVFNLMNKIQNRNKLVNKQQQTSIEDKTEHSRRKPNELEIGSSKKCQDREIQVNKSLEKASSSVHNNSVLNVTLRPRKQKQDESEIQKKVPVTKIKKTEMDKENRLKQNKTTSKKNLTKKKDDTAIKLDRRKEKSPGLNESKLNVVLRPRPQQTPLAPDKKLVERKKVAVKKEEKNNKRKEQQSDKKEETAVVKSCKDDVNNKLDSSCQISIRGRKRVPAIEFWKVNKPGGSTASSVNIESSATKQVKSQENLNSSFKTNLQENKVKKHEEKLKKTISTKNTAKVTECEEIKKTSKTQNKKGKSEKKVETDCNERVKQSSNVKTSNKEDSKDDEFNEVRQPKEKKPRKKAVKNKITKPEAKNHDSPKKVPTSKNTKRKMVMEDEPLIKKQKSDEPQCLFTSAHSLFDISEPVHGFSILETTEAIMNSIRKHDQNGECSGRETPPFKFISSFLDHTEGHQHSTMSLVSGDEVSKKAKKNHAADRVIQKRIKAKDDKIKPTKSKQTKQKNIKKRDPKMKEFLDEVINSKGRTPKKIKDIFKPKVTRDDSDDSFESFEDEFEGDSFADLQ